MGAPSRSKAAGGLPVVGHTERATHIHPRLAQRDAGTRKRCRRVLHWLMATSARAPSGSGRGTDSMASGGSDSFQSIPRAISLFAVVGGVEQQRVAGAERSIADRPGECIGGGEFSAVRVIQRPTGFRPEVRDTASSNRGPAPTASGTSPRSGFLATETRSRSGSTPSEASTWM